MTKNIYGLINLPFQGANWVWDFFIPNTLRYVPNALRREPNALRWAELNTAFSREGRRPERADYFNPMQRIGLDRRQPTTTTH